ncbi:MAG: hypothetical protein ISR46_06825 [Rhodospirillales bacterium]|nr:hypothetical protein [Rhodospirillales bacterium]
MARISTNKSNFTAGEISPRLLGRGDLRAYDNGASTLTNVFIHPTGGLSRRSGLRFIDVAQGDGRLIGFEFNANQIYLLAFNDSQVDVYRDDVKVADFVTPWTLAQVANINWTQSADTLLVVHPDVGPKKITRTSDTDWTVTDWIFHADDVRIFQPHHKFSDDDVTLTASATSGAITLTASADLFDAAHVGGRFRIVDKEVEITAVTSATLASADVKETLGAAAATKDWEEQAFSAYRGWPVSVCFHQDRMVIGGSRDLPNRLWLSKSADLFNFDLAEGLDDESIEFAILSDQVNAVRAVFSCRHLQVFTSGAEWMVSGAPLTPANIELHRQTQIGSPTDRTVPPRNVDGATLFVPRNGFELREFLFADMEQAYQSADLGMLASHLLEKTLDQDFDKAKRLFHMVLESGKLATVTIYRAEQVTAWTVQETGGSFRSVVVVDNKTYALAQRGAQFTIEVFDETMNVDCGLTGTDASAKTTWSGLDHLEGETVKVVGDGAVLSDQVVSSGAVTLEQAVNRIEIGLGFTHVVEPLPPIGNASGVGKSGGPVRPIAITFRLHETAALRLDTGRGFQQIPFKRFGTSVLDSQPQAFSGDKTIRAFGWRKDSTRPLWRIEQDTPLNFSLLSISTELSANG